MTSRWRSRSIWLVGLIVLAGCQRSEPVLFTHDDRLNGEDFAEKPNARRAVVDVVDEMFGRSPVTLRVPEGSGLPGEGQAEPAKHRSVEDDGEGEGAASPLAMGRDLYRRHCLHCHGVSGDGEGPTAAFLYPRPRDYRRGLFKFTSTAFGKKPTRDDLRRVLHQGIDGTSMPSFSAQLGPSEIERVIDYVIFLSMRGEVELALIEEAAFYPDEDFKEPEVVEEFQEIAVDVAQGSVFKRWRDAEDASGVVAPESFRVASTPESVQRGRDLFLGISTDVKLDCVGCHGKRGLGDGESWIDPDTFDRLVFNYDPADPSSIDRLKTIAEERQKRWGDEWGDPLRPANLNKGVYKGGRRPIDLYWRIATGITGTPMPAHAQALQDPDDLWHLVNFILALPRQPELLRPDQIRSPGVASRVVRQTTASR